MKDKFTRFTDGRWLHYENGNILEVEDNFGTELDYQPSVIEHILHLFGKHIWTIGVEPKYCVYPNCKSGKNK